MCIRGRIYYNEDEIFRSDQQQIDNLVKKYADDGITILIGCLLYTSDAADDLHCVDLGGRRIIKKKKT